MKIVTHSWIVGGLLGILSIAPAQAQDSTIHTRSNLSVASSANMEKIPPKSGLSWADRKFLINIAKVNRSEILMGELAQRQGGEWARAYGKDMEREHGLALEELKKTATQTGVALPQDVDSKTRKALAWLGALHGNAFDNAYRRMMINGHGVVLNVVQDEIQYGHNADVRSYAVTMEPAVKLHLKLAQQQTTMTGGHAG